MQLKEAITMSNDVVGFMRMVPMVTERTATAHIAAYLEAHPEADVEDAVASVPVAVTVTYESVTPEQVAGWYGGDVDGLNAVAARTTGRVDVAWLTDLGREGEVHMAPLEKVAIAEANKRGMVLRGCVLVESDDDGMEPPLDIVDR